MSDETKVPPVDGVEPESKPDPILNLKSEFQRKFDNQENSLKQITDLLKAQVAPKPVPVVSDSLKDVWYSNEEKASEIIETRAEKRIMDKLAAQQVASAKSNAIASLIYSEFPETYDKAHPLTKRANELIAELADEDKGNSYAIKAQVAQAALELGIRPKSRRDADSEDSSSYSFSPSRNSPPPRKGNDALPDAVMENARLMGLDVSDPKVVARLKSRMNKGN